MFAMYVEDVFEITGRGVVLAGKYNSVKHNIRVNECLYDFYGNQFWVKGIEMFSRLPNNDDPENTHIGLIIESHGKEKDYFRNKLLTTKFGVSFIFPVGNDSKSPDSDYKCEYEIAESLPKHYYDSGKYRIDFLDIDRFESSGEINIDEADMIYRTFYRGPKLSPEKYRDLYHALIGKNYYLVNTPEQYEKSLLHTACTDNDIYAYEYKYYRAFFLNKRLIGITDYCDSKFLKKPERDEISLLAQEIDSGFFAMDIVRRNDSEFAVINISDGQIAELNTQQTETFYLQLNKVIQNCRYEYTDPPYIERNIMTIKENAEKFSTPVGDIIITDENGISITFDVDSGSGIYYCPYGVYDGERLKYWLYPKNNYSITVSADKLEIGKKYRAVFTGGELAYGDSDEHTVCISNHIKNYSFSFGAYDYNDDGRKHCDYENYILEITDDGKGYEFKMLDQKQDVCFNVCWLKNNDDPDDCLAAVEFWTT